MKAAVADSKDGQVQQFTLIDISLLSSVQYFNTGGWVTREASGVRKRVPVVFKSRLSGQVEKKNKKQTGNPGSLENRH